MHKCTFLNSPLHRITEVWLYLRNKLKCILLRSQTQIYRKTNSWQENWLCHSQTAQWIPLLGQNESSIISTAFIMRQKWDCQIVANVITLATTHFFFQGHRGALTDKCSERRQVMEPHEYFHPIRISKGWLKKRSPLSKQEVCTINTSKIV